jgi:hypothetical protein
MVREFFAGDAGSAHDDFQRWRQDFPRGYFLNCRAAAEAMLHRASCTHVGETDEGAEVWGNMTHKRKVCATDLKELSEWAVEHAMRVVACSSCKPDSQ